LSEPAIIFVIIATMVALFVWGRLPVVIVALLAPLALFLTGILGLDEAFAGFGDSVIVFIASLFIVAAGLEATGVTAWVGQWLSRAVGASPLRLTVLTVVIVALLSPLISMSGAVAAMAPVTVLLALRMGQSPSKHLMPLAFASAAGSKLALTGTPKNVLVSDAAADAGYGGFGFFEFAWVGAPLLAGTVLIVALLGRRLLPDRQPAHLPRDFGQHARTLARQYALGDNARLYRVETGSALAGKTRAAFDQHAGVSLIAVSQLAPDKQRSPEFAPGDVLVLRGAPETLDRFAAEFRLAAAPQGEGTVADMLFTKQSGLAEVVVRPRSAFVGKVLSPGALTGDGQLVVVSIQRNGVDIAGAGMSEIVGSSGVELQPGDHLLLQGTWQALDRLASGPDVLAVDSPEMVRRQAVPLGPGSSAMLAIVAGMVLALATGLVPAPVGVLVAAMAVVAAGVLSAQQAFRAIDWNTIVLVASMLPLSTAMYRSGAAMQLADLLVITLGEASPAMLLAGLFLLTALLGQVISNTATTMILIPVAVAAAIETGVSAKPVLMSLNVAASAAFLTPVATSANLIVMGPGGYRFGDYWKLGMALMVLYFCVAVFWTPLIWRF
jgi:di/tricarboxylate transporter